MVEYQAVLDAIDEHGLRWGDIDRIHLQQEAYDEFRTRASMGTSNYATDDKPAVRLTNGAECIYFVDRSGEMQEIELDDE